MAIEGIEKLKTATEEPENLEKIELAKELGRERLEKLEIEIVKLENLEEPENKEKLKIVRDTAREKVGLKIAKEVEIEELEKLGLEILENLEKTSKNLKSQEN